MPLSRQASSFANCMGRAVNSFRRPRSNNTLNAALRRLGGEERKVPGGCLGTLLNETGALESGRDRATVGPARLAEISGLEVQDVDLQEMTINIRSMRHGD